VKGKASAWSVRNDGGARETNRGGSCHTRVEMLNSFGRIALDMDATRAAFDEVYVYTMGRPGFILQHVVDAFAVQTANQDSKAIRVVFGLVGLYLHVEKGFSGRQVQESHMKLGRRKREWPSIYFPEDRGTMTIVDVLAASAGPERDLAIENWCRAVWTVFGDSRESIIALLREYQIT
jgi:hypothetical protein